MRSRVQVIGLAAVAVVVQLATSGRADAALNYTGQTPQNVSAVYSALPANTQIVLVDEISGAVLASPSAAVSGSGTLVVPLTGLPPGQYFLQARQGSFWIAQTVMFYF
jgi:hypothetical protein